MRSESRRKTESRGTILLDEALFNRPERRPLSVEERSLLDWLIVNGNPGAEQFASQIAQLHVVGSCSCGCPSIDLAVGDREERTVGPSHVLADFDGISPEGIKAGVILHAREGQISELEVYAIEDVETPFSLPILSSLKKC